MRIGIAIVRMLVLREREKEGRERQDKNKNIQRIEKEKIGTAAARLADPALSYSPNGRGYEHDRVP